MRNWKSAKRKPQRGIRPSSSAEHRGRSLLDRDDEKSQHEMQEHLRMAANSHIPAAVRIVEMPVDALYTGAVAEADLLGGDDAHETSRKYQHAYP